MDEVVRVIFADVLDPKAVNDKGAIDGLGGMLPESGSSGHKGEAKMDEVSFESVVGN